MKNLNPKVLIVGGGLAGISLGILLKRNNVNVLVVERSKTPLATFKGEYLQPQTVNFLNKYGMGDIFENTTAGVIRELRFRDIQDKEVPYKVESELLIRYPFGEVARSLPYVQLQDQLRKLAHRELGDSFIEGGMVTPLDTTTDGTLTPNGLNKPRMELKFNDQVVTITPEWVVGCDGKGSQVRRWMQGARPKPSKSVTVGSDSEYIVGCEIHSKASIPNRYEVIRTPNEGTFSFFGLGNEKQRLYWNTNQANVDGKLWKESIRKSLTNIEHISHVKQDSVGQPVGAEANSAWFGQAYKGRFILVGDANSSTTPFGGQGMNAVVKHVEFLAEILSEKTEERAMKRNLESYQAMVFKYYCHLGLLNFGLYHLFFNRAAVVKPLAAHVINKWERKPHLKDRVARLFGGLDQDTPGPLELYELWGGLGILKQAPLMAGVRTSFIR
jgi:2-polyprenyl-6-methoxyphenol hydroxylase-like FAD-dependent oxidoreductase